MGVQNIFLESDTKVVIDALVSTVQNKSRYGHIVEDTRVVFNAFSQRQCGHVHRDANRVAHCLAKEATKHVIDRTWWDDTLGCIADIVRLEQSVWS